MFHADLPIISHRARMIPKPLSAVFQIDSFVESVFVVSRITQIFGLVIVFSSDISSLLKKQPGKGSKPGRSLL